MHSWKDHIAILRCPVTAEPLRALDDSEIGALNGLIASGERVHADGSVVPEPLADSAFVNIGGTHTYRVEQQIAWLLPALAIVAPADAKIAAISADSALVQSFYDDFGWVAADGGGFNDAVAFTAINTTAAAYTHRCNNRVLGELSKGRYLLDAASGPVPGPAYAMLSAHYDWRVCVDFSYRALLEAKASLGDHALCLLGDLTCLPLADGAVDDAISLHTIYHIPEALQDKAIDELVRAVRPGGKAIIVYEWRTSPIMETILKASMFAGQVRARLRGTYVADTGGPSSGSNPPIYFHPKPRSWFAALRRRHRAALRVFSVVNSPFQRAFMRDNRIGRSVARIVYPAERMLQPITARYGQYPMFVIRK